MSTASASASSPGHRRWSAVPLKLLAVALVAACVAVTPDKLTPQWLWAVVIPCLVVALLALGVWVGWPSLIVFPMVLIPLAIADATWVYDAPPDKQCDRACWGPVEAAILFHLPVALLLIAVGIGLGYVWKHRRSRGASRRPPVSLS